MRTDHLVALASAVRYHAVAFLEADLRARGIDDLVPSQGALLAMLYGRGGRASMKAIVEASGRGKSTMTEMANALERRGYLVRERDPEDSRGVILVLTAKSLAIRNAYDGISDRLLAYAWGGMPQKKRETLIRLLSEVVLNLQGAEKGGRPAGKGGDE